MIAKGDAGTTRRASGGRIAARLIETLPNRLLSEMPPAAAVCRRRIYRRSAKSSASVYTIRLATANRKIEKPTARALSTDNRIQPANREQTASGARNDQDRRILMRSRVARSSNATRPPDAVLAAVRTTRHGPH